MMSLSCRAAAIALALLLLAPAARAQTAAPATRAEPAPESKAAPPPTDKRMTRPRAPGSVECSKEADAKGLKGKERRKFRRECKKAAAEKAAAETNKP